MSDDDTWEVIDVFKSPSNQIYADVIGSISTSEKKANKRDVENLASEIQRKINEKNVEHLHSLQVLQTQMREQKEMSAQQLFQLEQKLMQITKLQEYERQKAAESLQSARMKQKEQEFQIKAQQQQLQNLQNQQSQSQQQLLHAQNALVQNSLNLPSFPSFPAIGNPFQSSQSAQSAQSQNQGGLNLNLNQNQPQDHYFQQQQPPPPPAPTQPQQQKGSSWLPSFSLFSAEEKTGVLGLEPAGPLVQEPGLLRMKSVIGAGKYAPGESRQSGWILQNCSKVCLSELRCTLIPQTTDSNSNSGNSSNLLKWKTDKEIVFSLKPQEEVFILVDVTAPPCVGTYCQFFRLQLHPSQGSHFVGEVLELMCEVKPKLTNKKEAKVTKIVNMGFHDRKQIISALKKHRWDVQQAITEICN